MCSEGKKKKKEITANGGDLKDLAFCLCCNSFLQQFGNVLNLQLKIIIS